MPYKDLEKRREFARNWARKDRKLHPEKHKERNKKWRTENREKYLAKKRTVRRKLTEEQKEKLRIQAKLRRKIIRKQVIDYYGGKCNCCGESTYEFLTIDHVNGGGCKHRKEISAFALPWLIIKNNYPKDYQVLCYNCNCAKAFTDKKICPHKIK